MLHPYSRPACAAAFVLLLLPAVSASAQDPTLVALTPAANAASVARNAPVLLSNYAEAAADATELRPWEVRVLQLR